MKHSIKGKEGGGKRKKGRQKGEAGKLCKSGIKREEVILLF